MIFSKRKKIQCKAAEESILFQPSGEMLPCHYNRGYILGKYPNDSIYDAWNGDKRKKLVKSICKNKLDLGCSQCKSEIEEGLDIAVGMHKYDFINRNQTNYPSLMELQLDNICNLECIMCSGEYSSKIRKNREHGAKYISPYDDAFIKQLNEFIHHLKHISFTGGEPLLFNIYFKIFDKIIETNPKLPISISTNGTILTERIKSYLTKLSFNFTISIDSVSKEIYESIRVNAKLENTLENIDYFNKYCQDNNTELVIKCLIMPQNYKYIPELYKYFNAKEIKISPKLVRIPYYASMESLSNNALNVAIEELTNIVKTKSNKIAEMNNILLKEIISQLKSFINNTNKKEYTTNENLAILKETLLNQLLSASEYKEATNDKINIDRILKEIYASINDETELKKAIINFIKIPSATLINEFKRSNPEKLIARFKQASLFYL